MIEFEIEATITIDETDRNIGLSDVKLTVDIAATQSPGIDTAAVLSRYWFRAHLMGFGREGNPSRRNARRLTKFGRRITSREPRFNWRTQRMEFVVVERILEEHRLYLDDQPSGHLALFKGYSNLTVDIGLLDVASARSFSFGGQRIRAIPPEAADAIFVRVELMDRETDDAVVLVQESNVISDYFGANERTSSGGDDRDFPRFPVTFSLLSVE